MAAVRMSFSLEPTVARTLKLRAQDLGKPASRYITDLVEAEARAALDELADEGYRVLAEDTARFAEETWPTAAEGLPEWRETDA